MDLSSRDGKAAGLPNRIVDVGGRTALKTNGVPAASAFQLRDSLSRTTRARRQFVPKGLEIPGLVPITPTMAPEAAKPEVFVGRETIIASQAMQQLMHLVRRVAQMKVSVLILGETGTGKEHIARALHHYSLRNARPWVDVNCGALPEHLMESELFGYER